VLATVAWAGDPAAGDRALAPFRALAEPLADLVQPAAYASMLQPVPPDYHPVATGRTGLSASIDGAAIMEWLESAPGAARVVQMRVLGGAPARVPADATAFAHRDARAIGNIVAMYTDPAEAAELEAPVAALAERLYDMPGAYVGFLADEGEERVRAAYPGATYERLAAVKAQYDPDNLFRLNQNVAP
jgi:FAD/FMN-containing dehydrogenase